MSQIKQSPMATFGDFLAKGQLAFQYSLAARRPFFYPRVVCPYSGTENFEWRMSVGLGTVYASTVLYPRDHAPYAVVLVDLDEGFRMMSRVINIDGEQVNIGARVRVKIQAAENGDPAPFFELEN